MKRLLCIFFLIGSQISFGQIDSAWVDAKPSAQLERAAGKYCKCFVRADRHVKNAYNPETTMEDISKMVEKQINATMRCDRQLERRYKGRWPWSDPNFQKAIYNQDETVFTQLLETGTFE
jgi:hypothetical protein